MPELTLEQKKSYLTTGPAGAVDWEDPEAGLENNVKTLAEWVALDNTRAIRQATSSVDVGNDLGLSVTQGKIPSATIYTAITEGKDFPGALSDRSMTSLNFALRPEQFDMSRTNSVNTIVEILEPTHNALPDEDKPSSALSYFNALRFRTATIAEHLGGLSEDEINAIIAD